MAAAATAGAAATETALAPPEELLHRALKLDARQHRVAVCFLKRDKKVFRGTALYLFSIPKTPPRRSRDEPRRELFPPPLHHTKPNDDLQKGIVRQARSATAHAAMGEIALFRGDDALAQRSLKQAENSDPANSTAKRLRQLISNRGARDTAANAQTKTNSARTLASTNPPRSPTK